MAASRVADCVNAAVDALRADSTLSTALGGQKVYTAAPQDTDPPYGMVIGGDETPWAETFEDDDDSGDSGGRQVDVIVSLVSTYRGSAQVDSLASRVMVVLLSDSVWSGVSGFQVVQFIRNQAQPPQDLNQDGVLWFQRFVTVRVTLA